MFLCKKREREKMVNVTGLQCYNSQWVLAKLVNPQKLAKIVVGYEEFIFLAHH